MPHDPIPPPSAADLARDLAAEHEWLSRYAGRDGADPFYAVASAAPSRPNASAAGWRGCCGTRDPGCGA